MRKLIVLGALAISGILVAQPAGAVPFDVTAAALAPSGGGYGIETCCGVSSGEASGTLLDVRFSTSGFASQSFNLTDPGDFHTFLFGTVDLQEPDDRGGILLAETDDLGVTATFTFTNPLGSTQVLTAVGTAITGAVSDSHVDYTLVFNTLIVPFGTTGSFRIELASLAFDDQGSQNLNATITLLTPDVCLDCPTPRVPAPATLALLGTALVGFVITRRLSRVRGN